MNLFFSVRIADLKDPRERMVQVVRWYLSAYHAGRKSTVAKKPYNPIIGEVFRCHWNMPEFGEKIYKRIEKLIKLTNQIHRKQRNSSNESYQ